MFIFFCLGFFVAWAFRVFIVLLVGRWRVVFFFCLGGGGGPANKKNMHPPEQQKINMPPTLPSVFSFFLLFGQVAVFMFLVCFFAGDVFLLCCLGWGVFILLLFGRGACFFLLFGRVALIFFAVWAGDRSSLTYRSAWLVFEGPYNKKDQTAENETRVPVWVLLV